MELRDTIWNSGTYAEFLAELKSNADEKYREFNNRIIKESGSEILGVRVPMLKKYAREISKGEPRGFIEYVLSIHETLTYEEKTILGFVIGYTHMPFGEMCERIREFAALVDSWACCDTAVPSFTGIREYLEEYKIEIFRFLHSSSSWENRVGIIILLKFYLSAPESAAYALGEINEIKSDEYYVMMAEAWLIAEALAKQKVVTEKFLREDYALDDAVRGMLIRKIKDSRRIPDDYAPEIKR